MTVLPIPVMPGMVSPTPSDGIPTLDSLKRKHSRERVGRTKMQRTAQGPQANVVASLWDNLSHTLGFVSKSDDPDQTEGRYPQNLPSVVDPLPLAVSYLTIGPVVRGRFDVRRAEELGVFGKDRTRLTAGESVLGKSGETVTPEMVIAPSAPRTVRSPRTPGCLLTVFRCSQ